MNFKPHIVSMLLLFSSLELSCNVGDYFWMIIPIIGDKLEKSKTLNDKITTLSALSVGVALVTGIYTITTLGDKVLEVNQKAASEQRLPTQEEIVEIEKDIQTKAFIINASLVTSSVALIIYSISSFYPLIKKFS